MQTKNHNLSQLEIGNINGLSKMENEIDLTTTENLIMAPTKAGRNFRKHLIKTEKEFRTLTENITNFDPATLRQLADEIEHSQVHSTPLKEIF